MMKLAILASAIAFCASAPAFAGVKEANACRVGLNAEGQLMFDATASDVKSDSKLEDIVRSHVRGLVMSGKLSREAAQANVKAAAACLKLLQS